MRYAILLIFFILQALLLLTAARKTELITALDIEARDNSVRHLAAAVDSYYAETNAYPASIAALAATTGYEYLRTTARPFQSLATASNLDDTVFKFNRVVVYTQDPYATPLTDAEYLDASNNACGSGAFATGTDWCGSNNSQWWKHESRDNISLLIGNERQRLFRVLHKFNAWYNDDITVSTVNGVFGNNYPNPTPATAAPLTLLVAGFAQTATTCAGIYVWKGIPLDCSDLYSIWGTPTVYNFISSSHIVLITKTPYKNSDGTALYVSTEESL